MRNFKKVLQNVRKLVVNYTQNKFKKGYLYLWRFFSVAKRERHYLNCFF